MKALCTFFLTLLSAVALSQFCNSSGNVIVYANYEGGLLTINVDEDIPNLKIGVCSYEACSIVITGAFASNVSEVLYAGIGSDNDHCLLGILESTISAPAGVQTDVLLAPPSVLTDANGNSSIICGYSCGTEYQGGCNTAQQIVAYFLSQFGGTLYYYYTQYGCWPAGSLAIGPGGNCCPGVQPLPPVAAINVSENEICVGDCIAVSDGSSGEPTSWSWSLTGGSPSSSTGQNPGEICFNQAGSYTLSLIAANSLGSSSATATVQVTACNVPGCMYPNAINYNPTATVDDLSCQFPCNGSNCPADLDANGFVGVSDLLLFVAEYGTTCPN
jgi:PKD repeat protein